LLGSAGIDMVLTVAGDGAGEAEAGALQLIVEYDPQPRYDAGSFAKSDPDTAAACDRASRGRPGLPAGL
jgi:hypothetical protein